MFHIPMIIIINFVCLLGITCLGALVSFFIRLYRQRQLQSLNPTRLPLDRDSIYHKDLIALSLSRITRLFRQQQHHHTNPSSQLDPIATCARKDDLESTFLPLPPCKDLTQHECGSASPSPSAPLEVASHPAPASSTSTDEDRLVRQYMLDRLNSDLDAESSSSPFGAFAAAIGFGFPPDDEEEDEDEGRRMLLVGKGERMFVNKGSMLVKGVREVRGDWELEGSGEGTWEV